MSSGPYIDSRSASPTGDQDTDKGGGEGSEKISSYVQLTCSFCKFKKRKCDGQNPCSSCRKNNQTCVYFADGDRRRRKYHTDYISYLEDKSDVLTKFINEFVKDSPQLYEAFNSRLSAVIQGKQPKQEQNEENAVLANAQFEDDYLDVLEAASRLKLDEDDHNKTNTLSGNSAGFMSGHGGGGYGEDNDYDDEFDANPNVDSSPPFTEPTSSTFDTPSSEDSNPLILNGLDISFKDDTYRLHLLDSFEKNFAAIYFPYQKVMPQIREEADFAAPVLSKKLLLCGVFAIGSLYSDHHYAVQSRKAFITEAEYIAMNVCRDPLDIYLVLGLSLLSAYELGMGNDSMSYLYDSMACSLTQHMGLHISYDQSGDANSAKYAPKASPLRSSTLWGICTQDRIITNICNVQSCIHFRRIIAPPFQTELTIDDEHHMGELAFAYASRLWYIYDRFMDQICSESGEIGDTMQRSKLLEAALDSMEQFRTSLPSPLILSDETNEIYIFVLHYTYYSLLCHFYKAFVKMAPNSTNKLIKNATHAAKLLDKFGQHHSFRSIPYHMLYLIYTNSLTYLVVLAKHKSIVSQASNKNTSNHEQAASTLKRFTKYFQTTVKALTELSTIWKRAKKDLDILRVLCQQNGLRLDNPSQTSEAKAMATTPVGFIDDITSDMAPNVELFITSPGSSDHPSADFTGSGDFGSNNASDRYFNTNNSSSSHANTRRDSSFTIDPNEATEPANSQEAVNMSQFDDFAQKFISPPFNTPFATTGSTGVPQYSNMNQFMQSAPMQQMPQHVAMAQEPPHSQVPSARRSSNTVHNVPAGVYIHPVHSSSSSVQGPPASYGPSAFPPQLPSTSSAASHQQMYPQYYSNDPYQAIPAGPGFGPGPAPVYTNMGSGQQYQHQHQPQPPLQAPSASSLSSSSSQQQQQYQETPYPPAPQPSASSLSSTASQAQPQPQAQYGPYYQHYTTAVPQYPPQPQQQAPYYPNNPQQQQQQHHHHEPRNDQTTY